MAKTLHTAGAGSTGSYIVDILVSRENEAIHKDETQHDFGSSERII